MEQLGDLQTQGKFARRHEKRRHAKPLVIHMAQAGFHVQPPGELNDCSHCTMGQLYVLSCHFIPSAPPSPRASLSSNSAHVVHIHICMLSVSVNHSLLKKKGARNKRCENSACIPTREMSKRRGKKGWCACVILPIRALLSVCLHLRAPACTCACY